ncbi:energy transducer TonB [Sunxiuqinia indica]|uniref:energy transducer TonB n=1 Tax=Sunxiuqinia indica TaxID=2692584 RepID=UPI00135B008A|nr:energy transducer TonB [Sunxiuqinia indica]
MGTKKSKNADLESKRSLFLSLGLVLSLGFTLLAFSWKTPVQKADDVGSVNWDSPTDIIIPLTKPEKKELAPPIKTVELFQLVDNDTELDDDDLDIFDTEVTDQGIDVDALQDFANDNDTYDKEEIVLIPDEMPEFPGGMKALLKFIANTVDYPSVAQETGIQGRVFVNFVVNADGQVSDARIIRGVDSSLDREALRVVNKMPRWSPGKQGGHAVRVSYNVPINFVLQ